MPNLDPEMLKRLQENQQKAGINESASQESWGDDEPGEEEDIPMQRVPRSTYTSGAKESQGFTLNPNIIKVAIAILALVILYFIFFGGDISKPKDTTNKPTVAQGAGKSEGKSSKNSSSSGTNFTLTAVSQPIADLMQVTKTAYMNGGQLIYQLDGKLSFRKQDVLLLVDHATYQKINNYDTVIVEYKTAFVGEEQVLIDLALSTDYSSLETIVKMLDGNSK